MEHLQAGKRPFRDKTPGTHLRSFFQYLFAQGLTASNLSLCNPADQDGLGTPSATSPCALATWKRFWLRLGQTLDAALATMAMLLLMARLGLRAMEVMAIQLDDIDWRAGALLVRGKGGRHDRLPLPHDVGEAISQYLQRERISAVTRTLFVTHRAPKRAFKDSQVINEVHEERLRRDRVTPPTPYVDRTSCDTAGDQHGSCRCLPGGGRRSSAASLPRNHHDLRQARYGRTSINRPTLAYRGGRAMTLRPQLDRYIAVRRQLGADLSTDERILRRFVVFADGEGAAFIDTDLVLRWLGTLAAAKPGTRATRFRVCRIFAEWLQGSRPNPSGSAARSDPGHLQRAAPYIYNEAEIAAIVDRASLLPSVYGMRGLTCSTLFRVIAVTGLRISEALGLDPGDLDLDTGVLRVRLGKLERNACCRWIGPWWIASTATGRSGTGFRHDP